MSETDAEFLDSMEQWVIGSLVFKREHRERLFALARRGAEAGKLLAERDHEYNRKTNALIVRHAEQLARRGAAMQWRPIEEAPKETGKYLLGWNGHHSGVIQYWPPTYEDDPEWVDESTEFIVPPITHFMPLPPPPAGEQE